MKPSIVCHTNFCCFRCKNSVSQVQENGGHEHEEERKQAPQDAVPPTNDCCARNPPQPAPASDRNQRMNGQVHGAPQGLVLESRMLNTFKKLLSILNNRRYFCGPNDTLDQMDEKYEEKYIEARFEADYALENLDIEEERQMIMKFYSFSDQKFQRTPVSSSINLVQVVFGFHIFAISSY